MTNTINSQADYTNIDFLAGRSIFHDPSKVKSDIKVGNVELTG
jgi:hypothetical protein